MAITTRAGKGSPLTYSEMDTNFSELDTIPTGKIFPKTKSVGIQIDTDSPGWGWHDLLAAGFIDPNSVTPPTFQNYRDGISEFNFSEGSEMLARWHLPHDYAPGTDLFIHVHWSHNNNFVTGGSITWGWETIYAKGHNQAEFTASKVVSVSQNTSITPFRHMIAETALSVSGGSATQLNTNDIETDGLILCRFFLDSNDLTVSSGPIPNPFVHFVDIHYQSTGLPTKQRAPDFWT